MVYSSTRVRILPSSPGLRWLRLLAWLGLLLSADSTHSQAEELRDLPTGRTAWIDLRQPVPGALPQTLPDWIEALEFTTTALAAAPKPHADSGPTVQVGAVISSTESAGTVAAESTPATAANRFAICRIRLHRPEATPGDLQVRLLFDDSATGERPSVSAWDELGNARWRGNGPLGDGLGLASSHTVLVPMRSVDYLEISTPGDGAGLRGAFLTWMGTRTVQVPVDFPSAPQTEAIGREPFRITARSAPPLENDEHRFGVVTATLQSVPIRLGGSLPPQSGGGAVARSAQINFELERPPLLALVRFEMLNATVGAAPELTMNERPLGPAEVVLPDLADPGFRGEARSGAEGLAFHYTGWVPAHKLVPGSALTAGMNTLLLELSNNSEPAAIRAVEIQLKYPWEKFDYTLQPPPP